ncbi:DUF3520 domain-containing protein, partial [Escherichia coli]
KGEALEIPHSPEKEPVSCLTDWHYPSEDMRFCAAVAAYGQKLRGSEYLNNTSWQQIKQWAQQAKGEDPQGYRAEFIRLIELADGVTDISQ